MSVGQAAARQLLHGPPHLLCEQAQQYVGPVGRPQLGAGAAAGAHLRDNKGRHFCYILQVITCKIRVIQAKYK